MTHKHPAGDPLLVYQCRIDLSSKTLAVAVKALRRYRQKVGSRWRKLPDVTAALLVLAVLRHDQRPADVAAGQGISASTLRRWTIQIITTMAAKAPRLPRVLRKVARHGGHAVLMDGTLIPIREPARRRLRNRYYSGKHHTYGLLFLAITDLAGNPLWISAAVPGRTAEITTARRNHLTAHLRDAGLAAFADLAYTNLDDQPGPYPTLRPKRLPPGKPSDQPTIITGRRPARGNPLTRHQKTVNQLITGERIHVERAFAHLKNWRYLTRLRTYRHATALLRALMTLNTTERDR